MIFFCIIPNSKLSLSSSTSLTSQSSGAFTDYSVETPNSVSLSHYYIQYIFTNTDLEDFLKSSATSNYFVIMSNGAFFLPFKAVLSFPVNSKIIYISRCDYYDLNNDKFFFDPEDPNFWNFNDPKITAPFVQFNKTINYGDSIKITLFKNEQEFKTAAAALTVVNISVVYSNPQPLPPDEYIMKQNTFIINIFIIITVVLLVFVGLSISSTLFNRRQSP